jgi:RNA polymerase sigma-70 factor (ECF subfamily)
VQFGLPICRVEVRARRELYDVNAGASDQRRLSAVLRAIYLLFNEGYHGANASVAIREDLCREALRLGLLLTGHSPLSTPEAKALVAMMCLHGARLRARLDSAHGLVALAEQDRSRWDPVLLEQGLYWLGESAAGDVVSEYHLEAAIAGHHAVAGSVESTDWSAIRDLYDALYRLRPSAVVALNRAIAVGMAEGAAAGLLALEQLPEARRLDDYPFYAAALGDAHLKLGQRERARGCFESAARAARNPEERQFFERRLADVGDDSWQSTS